MLTLVIALVVAAPVPTSKVPANLLQAQADAAKQAYEMALTRFQAGNTDVEVIYRWSRRWLEAQRELGQAEADKVIKAAEAHLERMQQLEKVAKGGFEAGGWSVFDYQSAKYYAAEAAVLLARAKAGS